MIDMGSHKLKGPGYLRSLLSGLLAAAVLVPVGLSAPSASAATVWSKFDRHCRTHPAGKVCSVVQVRRVDGQREWRSRFQVRPTGSWVKPVDWRMDFFGGGQSGDFCGGSCSRMTTDWNSRWLNMGYAPSVFTVRYRIPAGVKSIKAGRTHWTRLGRKCQSRAQGRTCLALHQRFVRNRAYVRGRLAVVPASGRWIKPRWVKAGANPEQGSTQVGKKSFCNNGCTRRYSRWSGNVVKRYRVRAPFTLFAVGYYTTSSGNHRIRVTF